MNSNIGVFDVKEAAVFLGAHEETIRRLARKGQIPSYKVGKNWRFRKEALIAWAETHYLRYRPPIILVIDNDPGIRKLMKRQLESEGYQVRLASDGADGLAWLNKESIDLIVLDLKMPGMNGAAFLREFRKQQEAIPVIVVTGYPDGDLMAEAIKYGPFTLLSKPIEKMGLVQAVRALLKGSIGARRDNETVEMKN